MSLWVLIFLGGAITFAIRLSFIALLERLRMPNWFWRALRFVPAAVLSAIIVPETATRRGIIDISWSNPQMVAGVVAVLVAWRTRNVLYTLLAGMVALLGMNMLLQ